MTKKKVFLRTGSAKFGNWIWSQTRVVTQFQSSGFQFQDQVVLRPSRRGVEPRSLIGSSSSLNIDSTSKGSFDSNRFLIFKRFRTGNEWEKFVEREKDLNPGHPFGKSNARDRETQSSKIEFVNNIMWRCVTWFDVRLWINVMLGCVLMWSCVTKYGACCCKS